MLDKFANLFKSRQQREEEAYLAEHHIQFDAEKGYVIDHVVLNDVWGARLEYFSNRKLKNFHDLSALFYKAILINEKIDLEIASGRYVTRLGNNPENLQQLKQIIQQLNYYYKEFQREK